MHQPPVLDQFVQEYPAGAIVFRQGEVGRAMYWIQQGSVEIRRHFRDRECVLAVLNANDFFGEMAVLNNRPRSATALIRERTQLLVIAENQLSSMLNADTDIAVHMTVTMAKRLERANQQMGVLAHAHPEERLVHCLHYLMEEQVQAGFGGRGAVYLPFTLRELADRAAVTPEQAVDIIERLARAGLLTSASAASIDGPGYVVAESDLLLGFLGSASVAPWRFSQSRLLTPPKYLM